MAIQERTAMTAAELQKIEFNNASAQVKRASYSPPADTAWAITGCTFAGSVTTQQADTVLPPLLDALDEVTQTMDDRFFMPTPSTIEPADHQFDLYVSSAASGTEVFVGEGNQGWGSKRNRILNNIAVDSKIGVYVLRLPAELDGPGRATLESAVEAIAGVTNCEVLLSGHVPANVTGSTLSLEVRYRLDPTPVEE